MEAKTDDRSSPTVGLVGETAKRLLQLHNELAQSFFQLVQQPALERGDFG